MKIGTEKENIELIEMERTPIGAPCEGDVRVSVSVKFNEFIGQYTEVWLEQPEINKFIVQLNELNQSRKGNANILSMSPDEFSLEIRSSDSLGHMEIETSLQRYQYSGEKQWPVKVSGGFQVEPEAISQLITGMHLLIK